MMVLPIALAYVVALVCFGVGRRAGNRNGVSRLRVAEKVSGLRIAEISAGAISLYEGIIINYN